MSVSRPAKLTHAQTILYEGDMLRYAAGKLNSDEWRLELDKWVCLEDFLVHFRNLIEFFGHPNLRPDDLSINKPESFWPDPSKRPAEGDLAKLRRPDLWDKYEGNQPQKISKYLHHCTETRVEAKDWEVGVMYSELKPILEMFENLLPNKFRNWDTPASVTLSTSVSMSTASGESPSKIGI